jgi:putative spermidine/putrescine transport system substrate-binding protein
MKRRDFLKTASTAAALGAAGPFFHVRPARADKGELVVVSWGGDYDKALRDFVFPAFEKATGYSVKLDAPPENAKVKAMVQSGNSSWDVLMTDIPAVLTLMKDDLLEPLDYAAIDKAKLDRIPKELQRSHALGQRIYSFNIVYNTNALPKSKHPRNWAEVWDAKRFPGGRSFNLTGQTSVQAPHRDEA